jgi:tetratricopeptide (TPR) repeat protein
MSLFSGSAKNIQVVFLYSSYRQDEKLQQQLKTHLSALKHTTGVSMEWCKDTSDAAKTSDIDNNNHIFKFLNIADVVMLLITPDFIHLLSENTNSLNTEIQKIFKRAIQGEITVVPVLMRQCHGWERVLGYSLTTLPKNGKAVDGYSKKNEAFVEIAQGLEEIVEELKQYQQKLQKYRDSFSFAIKEEYPLSRETLNNLNQIKQRFSLKDKDVKLIEEKITVKAELEFNQKLERYRREVLLKILFHKTLSEQDRENLRTTQQHLKLTDSNVGIIEQQVIQANTFQHIQQIMGLEGGGNLITKIATVGLIATFGVGLVGFPNTSSEAQIEDFLKQGQLKLEQGNYQGAAQNFSEAIKHRPKNINAYIGRGNAYSFLKKYKSAVQDYTKVISLSPELSYVYMNRAVVRCTSGDKKGAVQDYQKAANLYAKQGATNQQKEAGKRLKILQQKKSCS